MRCKACGREMAKGSGWWQFEVTSINGEVEVTAHCPEHSRRDPGGLEG